MLTSPAAASEIDTLKPVAELGLGAQLILCAARSWHAGPDSTAASPCALFRCAGIGQAAFPAFAGLLSLLAACPTAPCFGPLHDPCLSADEEGMIAAISALQAGEPWRAQRIVAAWTTPVAAPRSIGLMAVIARSLSGAGLAIGLQPQRTTLH